jgi:hypothetical protein
MLVSAAVTKDELAALAESLAPLEVVIDESRGRRLTLAHPRLELVPRRGLRIRGDARLTWDVAGVGLDVTIQAWQLLLEPRIAARPAFVLALVPVLEKLETKGVTSIVDGRIADGVSDALARGRERLAWDLGRKLSRRLPLSPRIWHRDGRVGIDLVAASGSVSVSDDDLVVTLRFSVRAAALASARSPTSSTVASRGPSP